MNCYCIDVNCNFIKKKKDEVKFELEFKPFGIDSIKLAQVDFSMPLHSLNNSQLKLSYV